MLHLPDRLALNQAILALAPSHVARADAPSTFADLMRAPRMVVWEGASDKTIFRDARVNHAFRAWHDAAHIKGAFPFTLEGETAACELQCDELVRAYPRVPQWALDLIRAEVIGQAEFFATHGYFPADQEQFHKERLAA